MQTPSTAELNAQIREASSWTQLVRSEIAKVVIGQEYMVDRLLCGLLANGHVLLEGVPGLAKTLTVRTLARTIAAPFSRIQFTPDLLPADILGTLIYHPADATFHTRKGPIFANILLADEINRAPAKVQSALLEAMQERQVTLGDTTHPLPDPFLVLATENPIDQEGTYPLPEAQVDRFLMKLKVTYPRREEERQIIETHGQTQSQHDIHPIVTPEILRQTRPWINNLYLDDKLKEYLLDIVLATRTPKDFGLDIAPFIQFGASPRASLALCLTAKAHAFLQGRGYVTPQDIKTIAPDVLRHRILPSYEAEAENLSTDDLIQRILQKIKVP